MGGLGPGIGGFEILVIGIVALLVVGPKELPMLMRRVGQFVAKARGMANEFRASFDEMARQSELDDLRKEVEALRSNQGAYALGSDAENAFKDIRKELEAPLDAPVNPAEPLALAAAEPIATGVDEWPDTPVEPMAEAPDAVAAPAKKTAAKKSSTKAEASGADSKPKAAQKPKATRSKKVDL